MICIAYNTLFPSALKSDKEGLNWVRLSAACGRENIDIVLL